jgi:hypothetical protein
MTPEEIDAQVAESRVAQGFPPGVIDPEFLAKLAARVAAGMLARATAARKRSEGGRPHPDAPSVPEGSLSVQREGDSGPGPTARTRAERAARKDGAA